MHKAFDDDAVGADTWQPPEEALAHFRLGTEALLAL